MCNVLFAHHKINDSLLFMTILSTDLRALRRRGYNGRCLHSPTERDLDLNTLVVDRILNQQKVERVRAEAARVQLERERKEAQETETRSLAGTSSQPGIEPPPYTPEKGMVANRPTPAPIAAESQLKANSRQSVLETFNTFRQRFGNTVGNQGSQPETKSLLGPPQGGQSPGHSPRPSSPSGQITSQDSIGM